ncbi:annexin D5-like [Tasmannia lanceolata]|uniref:annexin D5-like n=1 Tax=Tasmannia lanceolata TaxID=3420 RepID=UPI004063E6D3
MSNCSIPSGVDSSFSPAEDAKRLNIAFIGVGCNSTEVVNVLAPRDAKQRALIQQEYKSIFSEDLIERLSSDLRMPSDLLNSIDLRGAILLWMMKPEERDATVVGEELKHVGPYFELTQLVTGLRATTEVICSRSPPEIQLFKQAYSAKFSNQLEDDITSQALGNHKMMLLAYVNTVRGESNGVDKTMVEKDARALYRDGENKWGTDERTFINIFSQRSRAHLAEVADAYQRMYPDSLEKAVEGETSGDFRDALLAVLKCAQNPPKFFAEVLYKSMEGLGTDERTLTRVVVTRAEIDMPFIKEEYRKLYGKSLNEAIHSDTLGDYRTFLLALVGPD